MKKKKQREGGVVAVLRQGAQFFRNMELSRLRPLAAPALSGAMSFLLGTVKGPMGIYPFLAATLSASRGGAQTVAALLGALLACALHDEGGLARAVIAVGIVALRTVACFLKGDFQRKKGLFRRLYREAGFVRMIICSLGAAAGGCVSIVKSESVYYGLFSALLGIGAALFSSAALQFLSDRGSHRAKRTAGLLVLALGLTASLDFFGLPFSLGAVLAFLAAVYFSYAGGAPLGALVGFACGLAVGSEYCAAFGGAGIVCALLLEYSSLLAVSAAALFAGVLSLFGGGLDALGEVIPEIALASAVAAPLLSLGVVPKRLPSFLDIDGGVLIGGDASRVNERFLKLSEGMTALSKMLLEVGDRLRLPTKGEAARICSAARAKHCSGCIHEGECAGREDRTVSAMFNNMAFRLSTNGRVTARIVPESVARRCFNIDSIIDTVNSQAHRASGLSGASGKTATFAQDYSAVAELLREVAEAGGSERDEESEKELERELFAEGFAFSNASVYGKRARRVYMRGVDPSASYAGERDIRECAEEVLGCRLSSPEFSIDGPCVSASMHSVPAFRLISGRYAVGSSKESESGDSLCSFRNDEGYYYTLVSDGMGSGREAAITSSVSAAFLEKLLHAGCPMRSALELLNCFVRGSDGECFTTVDLMEADLYTGRARFIKSGAAPSFVIRRGQLYRLHSKTVPVGIMRALDAEAVSFDLELGDTVIMMSDGVTGSYEECPWLYELLVSGLCREGDPKALAKIIADEAVKNTGGGDDITVCVLKVEAA